MKNLNLPTSEPITRIHVTSATNRSLIDAALKAKTGTVILTNEQGIQITFTARDRLAWTNRLSQSLSAPPSDC